MAEGEMLYRCRTKNMVRRVKGGAWVPKYRYSENKIRPTGVLYLPWGAYPKGSDKRAEAVQRKGFSCERLTDGEWVDCTEEFL